MKKIIFLLMLCFVFVSLKGQRYNKFLNLSVKDKGETTYIEVQKKHCQYGCFEETAFMRSQLQPPLQKILLKNLPDIVADEVKKLKDEEYTKPIYVNKSCYIIKRVKKRLFRYELIIIYFDKSGKNRKRLQKY